MSITCRILLLCLALSANNASAQVLHVVFAIDTDSNLSKQVEADFNRLSNVLRAGLPSDKLNILAPLRGDSVTSQNIVTKLNKMVIDADDSVLFYYSGHGAFSKEGGHFLALTHGPHLLRSNLSNAISTRQVPPRFWAVITDSCANIPDIQVAFAPQPNDKHNLLLHLFFGNSGEIDINSSRPGQVSFCHKHAPSGSYFTSSLCGVFAAHGDQKKDWDEVFLLIRESTTQSAESLIGNLDPPAFQVRGIAQKTQVPFSFRKMGGKDVNGYRLGIFNQETLITKVVAGSPAENSGLLKGMLIRRINGVDILDDNHLDTAISFSTQEAIFDVEFNGVGKTVNVKMSY